MKSKKAAQFYIIGALVVPPLVALSGEGLLAVLFSIALALAAVVCLVAGPQAAQRKSPRPRD